MTRRELRVGIAGTGFIGAVHARSARLAGAHLAGVAASTPESAQRAADRLGAARAYASAEELCVDPGIDVVHICTPNHLHAPLAHAALAAGKHVVCEKPLATTAAEAEALDDAARAAGRVAAVPFVYRYYPTVREARARVASAELGAVHLVHGVYLQDWLLSAEDHNWRVDPGLGGASRAFADIGSHWCDLAEFVTGHRIARLTARTQTAVPERRDGPARIAFARADDDDGAGAGGRALQPVATEDVALLQFETDGGAMGSLVVSQVSAGRKNALRLEVDAADGALAFDQEEPEALWWGRRAAATLLRRDPATLSPDAARLATLPPGHPQGYADCFDLFVADVYAAIAGGDGDAPDGLPRFADGVRAARLTETVMASAREQRWIDVPAPVEVPR